MSWTKGDGVVIPFGTPEINFRRNKLTVVTIKVNDKSSANTLGYEIDESELGEMETGDEKTIEDGEVTDTPVTPEV